MERVSTRIVHRGAIATVRVDQFRHSDGSVVEREVVGHPGAVAIVAHDDEKLFLVEQPREAVRAERMLELPAGKLDVEGETALDCARRELAEEIGRAASDWKEMKRFYTSPGFAEEEVTIFVATGLRAVEHEPDPEERISIVKWPLERLDDAIARCEDAKSLIGMLLLRARLQG